MYKKILATSILLSFVAGANSAFSEENLWMYARGTDTRPQGSFEAKFSSISRLDKSSGQYTFHDIRPEIEYGITDKLTIGAEVLFFDHKYSVDDPDLQPMFDTQSANGGNFDKFQYAGYEISAKYNVLSPYKDAFGLSFGLGFEDRDKYRLDGADIDQLSYTGTVFVQKNWLDNKLSLVGNLKTELERRKSPGVLEEEIAFDFSVGLAYRFMPKHFIGLEYRRQEDHLSPYDTATNSYDPALEPSEFDFDEFRIGSRYQYGEYFGPSYHYAQKNWWVTTSILFQINGGGSVEAYNFNNRNYDEHERVHVGLFFGYEF